MERRKRGPYRQYLRQDEPYKYQSLRRKIRGRTKRCRLSGGLAFATEFEDSETMTFQEQHENGMTTPEKTVPQKSLDDSYVEFLPISEEWQDNQGHHENTTYLQNDEAIYPYDSDSSYDADTDADSNEGSTYEDSDFETPCNDDALLYEGAPLSLSSSILLILSLVLKHKLTGQCFTDLLAVIEAHCPKPNNCKTSVRKLFDHFKNIKGNLVKHLFCTYCKGYICRQRELESLPLSCGICGTSLVNNTSFFLEAPLDDQLKILFKGKLFMNIVSFLPFVLMNFKNSKLKCRFYLVICNLIIHSTIIYKYRETEILSLMLKGLFDLLFLNW